MKYCVKCGTALEDNMEFCHKCGTKAFCIPEDSSASNATQTASTATSLSVNQITTNSSAKPGFRVAMMVWAIIFFTFGTLPMIITTVTRLTNHTEMFVTIGMCAWCHLLSLMFILLMRSPKGNPHLFGKNSGMRKVALVHLCVWVGFAIYCTIAMVGGMQAGIR